VAGFREFVTGEVLTAANVDDFLAKQAVMKFADAAARDAALGVTVGGGNALRQGMVAYLDDTDDVLKYDGTAWTTVRNAGIGSNVVTASRTTIFVTTSTSPVLVTGLEVDITPSSDTAKVLVIATVSGVTLGDNRGGVRLFRGSTEIVNNTDAAFRVAVSLNRGASSGFNEQRSGTIVFLDSPASATSVNYNVKALVASGTMNINRDDALTATGTVSSITAIEVAA
jgi:hypothetical protein